MGGKNADSKKSDKDTDSDNRNSSYTAGSD